jgi:hypothetical protein
MAREVTVRDLADLGDERFEQLIASIVFAEHPDAERPATPDGGADVLLPATTTRRARVWQVKHYPNDIAWKKCEKSLDDAVASYNPGGVVFVFPRNLSKPQRDRFEERLVKRHRGVTVKHWGLQRIQEALASHPDITIRYFGEERGDVLPGLIRAAQQGGKQLENTRDLADRAFALDEYADVADPSFEYEVSFGRAAMKQRLWEDPPFMVVHETRGERRVSAEAWLRPEATANARYGFTNDDAGDHAREQVREAFAAGQSVDLSDGIWLRIENAPTVVKEAVDSLAEEGFEHRTSTLSPGRSVDFTLHLGAADDAPQRTFAVRALPPPKGLELSFGCIANGLALFADFARKEPPTIGLNVRLSLHLGQDAAANAAAARFMLAFFRTDEVVCDAPGLLPETGLVIATDDKPPAHAGALDQLELLGVLFDALAVIEQRFGHIDVPEQFSRQDFDDAVKTAQVLSTGGGSMSVEELVIELDHQAVDDFVSKAQAGHPGRHPLQMTVFGRRLQLGIAEFNTPPVRLVTKEKGSVPGMTRVRLRTEPKTIPFRLVADAPPARPSSRLWTPDQGPSGLTLAG